MKGIKFYQETVIHPNAAAILGVLWLGIQCSLKLGNGNEVTLAALSRIIYFGRNYFSFDLSFPSDDLVLLSSLRESLRSLAGKGVVYLLEPGERVGLCGDYWTTLPVGVLGYLDIAGILKLWDEELKTHLKERE